jgi:hypothetical protein
MRRVILGLAVLLAASGARSQQTPPKLECRDLAATGNFIDANETVVNRMACHVAEDKKPTPQAQLTLQAAPIPTTPLAPVYSGPITTKVEPGSAVFIAPMNGFETYLAAAMTKKKVQMVLVASEAQADFVLTGTSEEKKAGWAKMAFTGSIHSDDAASVTMTNRKSGAIAFAYAVNKKNTLHGEQTSAEACAKHLQEHIEGKE